MQYQTYEIAIPNSTGLRFLEVVACSIDAAHADVREAFGADVEIVSTRLI